MKCSTLRRAIHEGINCQKRKKVRCFILVRHPVERFLSYYKERTARRPRVFGWIGFCVPVAKPEVLHFAHRMFRMRKKLRTCTLPRIWGMGQQARLARLGVLICRQFLLALVVRLECSCMALLSQDGRT